MDTSETYIAMANCPEIQDGWEPKIGDLTDKGIIIGRPSYNAGTTILNTVIDLSQNFSIAKDYLKEDRIFKPRQDQLQGMLDYNLKHPDALSILISKFWVFNDPVNFAVEYLNDNWQVHEKYLKQFTSMEQLWLAFVMHELHGKTWDGEKWTERG